MSEANITPVLALGELGALAPADITARLGDAARAGWTEVELPSDVAEETVALARKAGLRPAALRWRCEVDGPCLVSCDSQRREQALTQIEAALERAAGWRALVVSLQPARSRRAVAQATVPEYADALQMIHEALRSLASPVARWGVSLAVEVPADGLLLSPAEVRELLEQVRSPDIGACLDLAGALRISSPADWVRTLRHRVVGIRATSGVADQLDEAGSALMEVRYAGPVVCDRDPGQGPAYWRRALPSEYPVDKCK
jgi:hexulose-6-phosphate isomerase